MFFVDQHGVRGVRQSLQRELVDVRIRPQVVFDISVDERGVGMEAKAAVAKEVLPRHFNTINHRGLGVDRLGQVELEQWVGTGPADYFWGAQLGVIRTE